MIDIISSSPLMGILLCLGTFWLGTMLQNKTGWILANPLMISVVLSILFLYAFSIPYETFAVSADFLNIMLVPATAVLAINIYEQRKILKNYFLPIVIGCTVGSITSLVSVMILSRLFLLDDKIAAALLPKSCTTAIAIDIAKSHGGLTALTVVAVIFTGILGAVFAPALCKIFGIKNEVAQGIAIGTSSHALGTTKAVEMGDIQGSMSGVALSVTGIITVILTLFL